MDNELNDTPTPPNLSPTNTPIPAGQEPLTAETATAPASAPAAHKSWLATVASDVETGVLDVAHFVEDVPKVIRLWAALSPQVKAVLTQIGHDVLTIVTDTEQDIAAVKSGNFTGAVTLSEATWKAIATLVTDGEAGVEGIEASIKALGVTIPVADPPAPVSE